jgi:HEAT repeat protein
VTQSVEVPGPEAIPEVRALLQHSNPQVRAAAAKGLALLAGGDAIPDLVQVLRDEEPGVRRAATEALLHLVQQVTLHDVPALRGLVEHPDPAVQRVAAEGLAEAVGTAGPEDIATLRELLAVEAAPVRRAVAKALARVGGRDAIPDLRGLLKDLDPTVREASEEALRELVTEEDLDWLAEWVIAHPLDAMGEAANRLLVHLDGELYGPFD